MGVQEDAPADGLTANRVYQTRGWFTAAAQARGGELTFLLQRSAANSSGAQYRLRAVVNVGLQVRAITISTTMLLLQCCLTPIGARVYGTCKCTDATPARALKYRCESGHTQANRRARVRALTRMGACGRTGRQTDGASEWASLLAAMHTHTHKLYDH